MAFVQASTVGFEGGASGAPTRIRTSDRNSSFFVNQKPTGTTTGVFFESRRTRAAPVRISDRRGSECERPSGKIRTAPSASSTAARRSKEAWFRSSPCGPPVSARSFFLTTGTTPRRFSSERSTGIRQSVDFATKTTGRGSAWRTSIGSTSPLKWFATKITGPSAGTFSFPAHLDAPVEEPDEKAHEPEDEDFHAVFRREPHLREDADRCQKHDEENRERRVVAGRAPVREEGERGRPEKRPEDRGRFAREREEAEELRRPLFRDEGHEPEAAGDLDASEADAREEADEHEGLRVADDERENEDDDPVPERDERRGPDRDVLAQEAVEEASENGNGRAGQQQFLHARVVEAHGEARVRRHLDLDRVDDVDVEKARDEKPQDGRRRGKRAQRGKDVAEGGRGTGGFLRR